MKDDHESEELEWMKELFPDGHELEIKLPNVFGDQGELDYYQDLDPHKRLTLSSESPRHMTPLFEFLSEQVMRALESGNWDPLHEDIQDSLRLLSERIHIQSEVSEAKRLKLERLDKKIKTWANNRKAERNTYTEEEILAELKALNREDGV